MAKKNHDKENAVFERFVRNPKDVIAMIAYCLYRLEKIDFFKKNPTLTQPQKDNACDTLIAGNHFDRFMDEARKAITAATDKAVADAVKRLKPKGFRAAVWEGIVAGVVTLILAPLVWLGLYWLLVRMDVWPTFAAWVASNNPGLPHQ